MQQTNEDENVVQSNISFSFCGQNGKVALLKIKRKMEFPLDSKEKKVLTDSKNQQTDKTHIQAN
jgi:hypothetical protein